MNFENLTSEQLNLFLKMTGEAATHSMLMVNHWRERREEAAIAGSPLEIAQQRIAHLERRKADQEDVEHALMQQKSVPGVS